ncbi:MAG: hypothetical protein RAP03_20605, partial [Candidatus Electryonea clarkiae]|nr:hypothetical protein [Candidatus Electryonea clarkiae]
FAASSTGDETSYLLGLRYIPEGDFSMPFDNGRSLDIGMAVNLSAMNKGIFNEKSTDDWRGKAYRATLRYNTAYSETRVGLQKINFGPAQVLRAEQWFDALDPRDPLSLTPGVWGMVHRRYFRNNANFWIWGLYGNEELKGIETTPTAEEMPEWGGRLQLPALGGSSAITMHHRNLELSDGEDAKSERLVALDGRWDYGAGFWFEAVAAEIVNEGVAASSPGNRTLFTLGIDYTLGVGSGIYVLGEVMHATFGDEWLDNKAENADVLALGSSYPLGLSDQLSTWVIHSPDAKSTAWIGSWSHTRENWTIQSSLFSYPEESGTAGSSDTGINLRGKGAQLHLIYNH